MFIIRLILRQLVVSIALSTIKRKIKEKISAMDQRNPKFGRQTKYFYKKVDLG